MSALVSIKTRNTQFRAPVEAGLIWTILIPHFHNGLRNTSIHSLDTQTYRTNRTRGEETMKSRPKNSGPNQSKCGPNPLLGGGG